jgi:hypothetical protein
VPHLPVICCCGMGYEGSCPFCMAYPSLCSCERAELEDDELGQLELGRRDLSDMEDETYYWER